MSDEAKETRQFGLRPGVGTSFPGRGKAKRCLRLGGDQGSPNTVDLWSEIPYICGQKYRTSVVTLSCIGSKFGPDSEAISGGCGPPTY